MRFLHRAVRFIVLTTATVALIRVALHAMGSSRTGRMRTFNKYVTNRVAMRIIAHSRTPYGVVHHVGRHSGKAYTTPVVAKLTPTGLLIPLPYGADTDWCLNVMQSGGCTLTLNGQTYELSAPHVVSLDVAAPLLPPANARLWRWMGIKDYLVLAIAEPTPSATSDRPTVDRLAPV